MSTAVASTVVDKFVDEDWSWCRDAPSDKWQVWVLPNQLEIAVSLQHHDFETIGQKIIDVVEVLPQTLKKRLYNVVVPFEDFTEKEQNQLANKYPNSRLSASAHFESGSVFVLGKDHKKDDYPPFCLAVLAHEAAHTVNKHSGGAPENLVEAFEKACQKDVEHHLLHPELKTLDLFNQRVPVHGHPLMKRHFLYADKNLNKYAALKDCENWAESTQAFVCDMLGNPAVEGYSFKDFWPGRHEFFSNWLNQA